MALSSQEWASAVKTEIMNRGFSQAKVAQKLNIDDRTLRRLVSEGRGAGVERDNYNTALGRLLNVSPEVFENTRSNIRHLNYNTYLDCERYGQTRTLWVPAAVTQGRKTFEWDFVSCIFDATEYPLPPRYEPARREALANFGPKDDNRIRGCLVRADRVERGSLNQDGLEIVLGYSDYASKRAITDSQQGRALAHDEITHWHLGSDLIPHLNVGVGCHVCIITRDGKTAFARRKNRLRQNQYDVGAVEGLAPYLDKLWDVKDEAGNINPSKWTSGQAKKFNLKAFFERSIWEEFHVDACDIQQLNCFGIGCDLAYSQWNFIGSAYINLSFAELAMAWPKAQSRDEYYRPTECNFLVGDVEVKIRGEKFWSSGMACLLYSLRYHYLHVLNRAFPYDKPYSTPFRMDDEYQYFLSKSE